ncbi:MAG: lactoylglutathione lyase family protein [Ilumatobacteraceae bacterium]|nr:lactoylglutathione lyase family protein [Ilumatobacteraceae bacterium]
MHDVTPGTPSTGPAPTVMGVHHVAIGVTDVEESIAFYGLLGLTPLPRPDFGFPGAWLQAGGQQVHLLQTATVPPGAENHYAFLVEDLDATVAHLNANGVDARVSGRRTPGAGYQAFLKDPSGNVVELNQPDR